MKEPALVPEPEFESYYGRQILKTPTWKTPDVPVYLFLGGLAGGAALLAEGAAVTGRPDLELLSRGTAATGAALGTVALIHDLGRPARFLNMLRVFKPTSPLSVGSFILAPFATLAAAAFGSRLTGRLPGLGRACGMGAAVLGPPLTTYTAALVANTAVPAWHEAHRELPFVFAGSGASAAGGFAMLAGRSHESSPAVRFAAAGAALEVTSVAVMERRTGLAGEPYRTGRPGRLMHGARALTLGGVALGALGPRWPALRRLGGALQVAGSLVLRFGVFEAGTASAQDPKYVVVPQRERLARREATRQREAEGAAPA